MDSMDDIIVKNSAGFWWPKYDGNGKYEGDGSCWAGNLPYLDTPEIVSRFVPDPVVCVQAGGNCGPFVKKYAELFQLVYTFEPDPVNFYCLTKNTPYPNVFKFQACLGYKHETVDVTRYLSDVGSTYVKGSGVVPTLMIDDLGLPRCDLIHLDIEGYELNALKGAVETIKRCHPILEVCEEWAARYQSSPSIVDNWLLEMDYVAIGNAHADKVYKYVANSRNFMKDRTYTDL